MAASPLSIVKRLLATFALMAMVMTAYFLYSRPHQLNWGVTSREMEQTMPGDGLEPHPQFFATRAITISGSPKEIWPWLLQMGYGRAGYYGYDILENLGSKRGIRSADRILPEFQRFRVGDDVPISSVDKMVFHAIEPNRYLIWTGTNHKGSFLWALQPVDEGHTRLISRIRWTFHWKQPDLLLLDLFTEFTDYLAVREILHGVKGRVENHRKSMTQQITECVVYALTALAFVATLIFLVVRPLTRSKWLTGLLVGAAWLVTWYGPVPIWVGAGMEFLALWRLWHPHGFPFGDKLTKTG